MTKIFAILNLLIFTLTAYPQGEDIVYLKNGSIIRGKINEIKAGECIKIQTMDGSLWVFNNSDIEKYDKKYVQTDNEHKSTNRQFLKINAGFIVGTSADNSMKAPLSLLALYSIPVYKNIYAGLGAGFEFYQTTYFPILIDIQYKPKIKGTSFSIQAGYTMPVKKSGIISNLSYDFESGYLINPEMTYTFAANQETAFTISIGYRYQKTSAKQLNRYYNDDFRRIEKFNRLVLRFGYTFS